MYFFILFIYYWWYGHVMLRDSKHVVQKAIALSKGKKGRGRPPLTWWTSIANLMKKTQLPDPTTLHSLLATKYKESRPQPTWERTEERKKSYYIQIKNPGQVHLFQVLFKQETNVFKY